MPFRIFLVLVFAACGLVACRSSLDESVQAYQAEEWRKVSDEDRKICASNGGAYEAVGMVGAPSCVVPYLDAGKACRDSSDCEGKCTVELSNNRKLDGNRTSGFCEVNNAHFGCFAEILDGVEQPGLCVD
ncbi:hypothetical protein [Altererythrobacter epoxidivorans]|uniref:hypothetical protein n=1 Tax=Altererythrobacter epoxidivorans TaxID=361183 RepID=UPI0012ED4B35|nr:hypothetical protein [Altererythrobacter epoxidivorans]